MRWLIAALCVSLACGSVQSNQRDLAGIDSGTVAADEAKAAPVAAADAAKAGPAVVADAAQAPASNRCFCRQGRRGLDL